MLFGGGTGGQFAEEAEESGRGFLIGEVFERHRGREVRRGRVEADADEILVAPGGQRIHHRAEFDRPVFLGGQNDRAGTGDGPGGRVRSIPLNPGLSPPTFSLPCDPTSDDG